VLANYKKWKATAMSELINAYNNSWPFVQIFMLATLLGLVALPVWLTHRWLKLRKKLPDNVLLALAQDDDVVTLTVRQGAPITPNQLTNLLTASVSQADIHAEPARRD
jgi:hypothetical protein